MMVLKTLLLRYKSRDYDIFLNNGVFFGRVNKSSV